MKYYQLMCLLFLTYAVPAQQQKIGQRPNIILFLVDDMGWTDCSLPFGKERTEYNKIYRTPNMERLADKGMRFSNAYATSVCTPTRVSLMTGMNTARHRVVNWTRNTLNAPTDMPYAGLQFPKWNYNGLALDTSVSNSVHATTLPALLRDAGYYTIHTGKGHFAPYPTPGSNPSNLGFVVNIAGDASGSPGSYLGTENFGNKEQFGYTFMKGTRGLEAYHGQDIFLTEALTLEAKKQLDNARALQKPFFLYMAHYAIHTPYKADSRFYQYYLNLGLDSTEAKYATLIEGMDKSLGDLMDYLEEKKIVDNTIILFMSDNGGLALSPPRVGKAFAQNFPLRSGKGSLYEGGIRVPMIAFWPKVTKPGSIQQQPVIIEDFFPTILEMAGITSPKTKQEIDGITFVPFLRNPGKADSSRALVWHFPSSWEQGARTIQRFYDGMLVEEQGMGPVSAIRKGTWKLMYFFGTGKTELYNLNNDIGERWNLAGDNPAKLAALSKELLVQLNRRNAQFPISESNGKEVKPPHYE